MSSAAPAALPLGEVALFLDFDGTMVEIAAQPAAVVVPPELPTTLERLRERLGGALAVVTGRRIEVVDGLLRPARLPAAGVHGEEIRTDPGGPIAVLGHPLPADLLARILEIAERARSRWPGIRVENKGSACTVHYRQAPEAQSELHAALSTLPLGEEWQLLASKMVYEVKSRHWTKGTAIRRFMEAPPFAGRRPVAVGDDATDLDSIAAAADLGGFGVAVGGLQTERAEWALQDPAAVRAWLRGLLT